MNLLKRACIWVWVHTRVEVMFGFNVCCFLLGCTALMGLQLDEVVVRRAITLMFVVINFVWLVMLQVGYKLVYDARKRKD